MADTDTVDGAAKGEQRPFQAEVAKLLHLMVHSVYSEREVFLRELISNAADALDKLRYASIADPGLLADGGDLRITIRADKVRRLLSVADTGIGMDETELVENLGTIARSGTQAFMASVKDGEGDVRLIGQFGIGFYSAFMVAGRVEVVSRKAGTGQAFLWASDGGGTFEVAPYDGDDAPLRGTVVRLHIREDAAEFLEDSRLEQIVRTYSDHIAHPIMLAIDGQTARQLNTASAIWTRPKAEVTADQHKEFFGHVSGSYSEPALVIHYRAEGRHEYTVLLYVPAEQPVDLFDPERRGRQKLYVRRVFIADDAELLPAYLRFVRGIIDSEDMPLNISREMLQDNPIVGQIRKAVTNRVLAELKKCADNEPETFGKIWKAFGAVLKEGLYEDWERRDQLYDIVRFRSTESADETRSLKDYIAGLKPNQTAIYYLTAEDAQKAAASPQLEGFKARGVEVLLLADAVDSFWVKTAMGYDGKPFRSVTQGAADLGSIPLAEAAPEKTDEDEGATATLVAALKQALGDRVNDVRRSPRLTRSAVCLVAPEGGFDRTLEKLLARQKAGSGPLSAPILEINPAHPLIRSLAAKAKAGGAIADINEAAELLLDQAHILEGEPPADAQAFAGRIAGLMEKAFA